MCLVCNLFVLLQCNIKYPVPTSNTLDLHGHSVKDAKRSVNKFLKNKKQGTCNCVCVRACVCVSVRVYVC